MKKDDDAFHHSCSNLYPFPAPGFPWRVRFYVQRRKPRDQRRNFKNSRRSR